MVQGMGSSPVRGTHAIPHELTRLETDMVLSTSDFFALMIALMSVNLVLIIAFRRVYVLERRLRKIQGYYDAR
jgi:hypothetical protein